MSANKDQKPTPRRLREARKRGDVVFSADVASTAVFAIVVAALWLLGATSFGLLRELWLHATSAELLARPDDRLPELLRHTGRVLLWIALPVTGLAALAGIAGSFFQVGGVLAFERLKPDIARLSPSRGLQRIFSTRNLVNLLKMLVKTLLLAVLVAATLRGLLDTALKLGWLAPEAIMAVGAHALLGLFAAATVIYAALAAVDYVHQHHEHVKSLRMSIDEVRRDHKDAEGDPLTRARRRGAHLEAIYAGLGDRVAAASAVIHSARVAVALQYLGERDLPRVIARGENEVAMRLRELAADARVPLAADAGLAERLYDEVPLDQPIPRPLYAPVAKLLRWAHGDA
ncbi:MAG: EscU/YscU/HrcU family type III secretion system export apparatus switch protein [Burkholderiales bacterium]|nr:EscU/YscU/HrcU family type III secretion system export apparatus switch protein [Burkholderiales bacterium]